ncbi:MAG: histidinol-phosphate transaminase [Planctomycetes bacterium]|nr:histidinol-phosphate transaminase [Planctomycetota bacterium]
MLPASTPSTDRLVRPEIAAIEGYVPGEQPQSGKWIKLNTNENPYPPSPAVGRALAATAAGRTLAKYPDPMATAFRRRAAEVLGVDPDWIICGNGSDDLLTILVRTFVGEGECLRMPYPSYILYRTLAGIQGAGCEEIHYRPDWSLGDEFAAPRDDLRLAIVANPNSPSGTLLPPSRVAELAASMACAVVVDEAYGDFADTNCLTLVKENPRVIVTRSFSKSYALAGLRFGFAIAQPALIQQMLKVKDSYNCDALSIAAATAAIDDQAWLADNRAKIIATRTRLIEAMRALGFDACESQANFVWCTHPERPHRPFYEALKAQGILIRFMNYAGWGDGLRITVGTDDEIDAFLAVMKTL